MIPLDELGMHRRSERIPLKGDEALILLKAINDLVDTDEMFELDCKQMPGHEEDYTQAEARQMCDLLCTVYLISHCIYCESCRAMRLAKIAAQPSEPLPESECQMEQKLGGNEE